MFIVFSDDKNLPSVPPLQLSVPADYPDQSPYWADDGDQYGETKRLLPLHVTDLIPQDTWFYLSPISSPLVSDQVTSCLFQQVRTASCRRSTGT